MSDKATARSRGRAPKVRPESHAERLQAILAGAVADLNLGGASLYLLNDARDLLTRQLAVDSHGTARTDAPASVGFDLAGGIGRMMNGLGDSAHGAEASLEGHPADAAVPLKVRNQVIGLLSAGNAEGGKTAEDSIGKLGAYADQVAYVIDAARAEAKLAVEAEHERTLLEVSRAISSALNPQQVLQMVAELMAKGVGAKRAAVYVWEKDLKQLRRRADCGVSGGISSRFAAIPFEDDNPVAAELQANRPVLVAGRDENPTAARLRGSIQAAEARIIPLISKSNLIAVAVVERPDRPETSEQGEVDLLMAIAGQAAVSVENATLYDAQNRAVTDLAALYAVSQALAASFDLNDRLNVVAQSIAAVTGVSRCGVFLVEGATARGHLIIGVPEEESARFRELRLGLSERETAMMQAIKEGQPTVIDARASRRDGYLAARWNIRRMLAVPLIFEGRTVGLAAADEPGHVATFSPSVVKVAAAIGEQAAISIQNSRLFEQTRQHAEDLGVLWEAGQALSSELGLDELLDTLIQQLRRLPGVDAASVVVRNVDRSLLVARDIGVRTRYRNESFLKDPCDLSTLDALHGQTSPTSVDISRHPDCVYDRLRASDSTVHSQISFPLTQRGEVLGVMSIVSAERREFSTGETRLVGSLASLGAAAIARAQLFERERRIAETLQRSLLPDVGETFGEFELAYHYAAALDESRVGGDFYDVFSIGGQKLALVIGDVSGKGLNAAVHTAMSKYLLRAYAFEDQDPGRVLSRVNDALCFYVPASLFVTLFLGILDLATGRVEYANAGHELPLAWSNKTGRFSSLAVTGRALGFLPNCSYVTEDVTLEEGDSLIMYTDGISEARSSGQFFDIAGVRDAALEVVGASAGQIVEAVETKAREFTNGPLRDDVALLVVKRHQSGAKAGMTSN